MVGGGRKMAELMLLSEIADPTRFFTDNLLSPEDWGARSGAPGEERAEARHGPEARGKAAEGERGRLGGRRAHPPRESAAGLALPRDAGGGKTLVSRGSTGLPGVRGEGLDALGCKAERVGGRWVWSGRANEGWSRGWRATLLTRGPPCRQHLVQWPG